MGAGVSVAELKERLARPRAVVMIALIELCSRIVLRTYEANVVSTYTYYFCHRRFRPNF
jgi:hypothetical protein